MGKNHLKVNGNGNIVVNGIHKSTVNINISKSVEYKELMDELNKLKKYHSRIPKNEIAELSESNQKIQKKEDEIEKFKQEVIRLAEIFNKIEINTERLRLAKQHFKEGKFKEADAILKIEDMEEDQENLLKQKRQYQTRFQETEKKLSDNANEFIIKAKLTALQYNNPNRLKDSINYFEKAVLSDSSADNYFEFAYFLQVNNQFNKAIKNYQEALEIYRKLAEKNPDVYLPYVATTLNNLGVLQKNKNEVGEAERNYQEALEIYRKLAEKNPDVYLPYVATTLNNLGVLQKNKNEVDKAERNYQESLEIRRKLAEKNPKVYEINLAKMIIIGVNLFKKDKTSLQEANKILQKYQHIPLAQNLMKIAKRLE